MGLKAVYYLAKKFLSFLFRGNRRNVIASPVGAKQSPSSEIASLPSVARNDGQRKILTVISRTGFHGGFGQANYAAAKGGVIALTKTLAQELGKKQILVNAINPGFMNSRMTESIPADIFEKNVQESLLNVISSPEAVADFMIYLLSDRFQNVTGQVFHLDSRQA